MKALIIVDVQNDFCPGGSFAVPKGDEIIPVINKISAGFDLTVATRDWHPERHISFSSTHGKEIGDSVGTPSGEQLLWPDHCIGGTPGADFHRELDLRPVGLIIHKGRNPSLDSYSAFYENDGKTSTGLAGYLKGLGITEVYLTGLATDYCVLFSALDSVREGFKTSVIIDACRGVNFPENSVEKAVSSMKNAGVAAISSSGL